MLGRVILSCDRAHSLWKCKQTVKRCRIRRNLQSQNRSLPIARYQFQADIFKISAALRSKCCICFGSQLLLESEYTVLNISKLKNATVLKCFAILRTLSIVWNELLGVSPSSKICTCTAFINIAKHGEITTKFQFTGTGAQPHRNRK